MSLLSQTRNMIKLGELLSNDLGYDYDGPKESGPNGKKKEFLTTGRAFLSALAKDLGFKERDIHTNKAGIAVSGEVYLYGMWESSGIMMVLEQDIMGERHICYRTIKHMKDSKGGHNHFITLRELKAANYGDIIARVLLLRDGLLPKEDEGYGYDRRVA